MGLAGIGITPEIQRNGRDLSELEEEHPLKPLILSCLKDDPKERPDIVTIHTQLLTMVEGVEVNVTLYVNIHVWVCSQFSSVETAHVISTS